jgi:hypothetical protein
MATCVAGALAWSGLAYVLGGSGVGAVKRSSYLATDHRLGWFSQALAEGGVMGLALVILGVVILIGLAALPGAAVLGRELRTWLWAYPLFLVAVTPFPSGFIRYLLLCPPLAMLFVLGGLDRGRRHLLTATVLGCTAGLAFQRVWIDLFLVVTHSSLMP